MTVVETTDSVAYAMPVEMDSAYRRVHGWLDITAGYKDYQDCTWRRDGRKVVTKATRKHAAFYFDSLFPTHFFKLYRALLADIAGSGSQLVRWLNFNPNLAILDMGCGDGAGTCALIAALAGYRREKRLDPRALQVHAIGVDVDVLGLEIYRQAVSALAREVSGLDIKVSFETIVRQLSDAGSEVESQLNSLRKAWGQPYLARLVSIESNLNDYLQREDQVRQAVLRSLWRGPVSEAVSQTQSAFGVQLATFYRQLLEMTPIDQVYVVTVDTKPDEIAPTIQTRLQTFETRLAESNHSFQHTGPLPAEVSFMNPTVSYWQRVERVVTVPEPVRFVVSTCGLSHHGKALDSMWNRITDFENLELGWARARRELLAGALSDEVEIRLFEYDLSNSLERVGAQLDLYAIQAGYIPDTLRYAIPKSEDKARPHGLDWLENELMTVAIIQVAGELILERRPYSFAYRLSQENNADNGATEYLYERWADAWKSFQREAGNYAKNYPEGVVFSTDIARFFEQIEQGRVNDRVSDELRVGSKRVRWLIERLVNRDLAGHHPGRGLVQGGVGSGFWANLYLSPLDNEFRPNDPKERRLFRYVDDIYVVIPDPADKDQTEQCLNRILTERLGLTPNQEKTDRFSVPHFLEIIAPDDELDRLKDRHDQTTNRLRQLSPELWADYGSSRSSDDIWWSRVETLRDCLTEIGLFITMPQLGRAVQRACAEKEGADRLDFPLLPINPSIAEAREWAEEFRHRNPEWATGLTELKRDLALLFANSHAELASLPKDVDRNLRRRLERRLRFAINRLGLLGLDQAHDQLTAMLCDCPGILRNPQRLIDDLARQAYATDVLRVLNAYTLSASEAAPYMRAIAIKALRLLPRLEPDVWEQLVCLMFEGDEITRLMATETWLILASGLQETPYASRVHAQALVNLQAPDGVSRRLHKNYILVLGVVDSSLAADLPVERDRDPVLLMAHSLASQGKAKSLFTNVEPGILRWKYYSKRYEDFDSEGAGPY